MMRFFLRRLLAIPIVMILANAVGYVYAYFLGPAWDLLHSLESQTSLLQSVAASYLEYLRGALHGDFGTLPNGGTVVDAIWSATAASAGLLIPAFALSIALGLFLGKIGVRSDRQAVSYWLMALSVFGQSSPTFYIGILLISASILYLLSGPGREPLFPFVGFGWDAHMVLPVLALMARPMLQIAHSTGTLLSEELGKQYVVVLHGMGHSPAAIRGRFAFRNVLALVILVIAGSWRLLVVELIVLERLFSWPGLGRLLSSTLIISQSSANFLFPPLLAGLLFVLAFFFMIADLIASVLARSVDPRLTRT
ncbi:MAG: ABC transporter permease [Chloroflexota bacterium]